MGDKKGDIEDAKGVTVIELLHMAPASPHQDFIDF